MTERGLQSELIEGIRARGGRATLGDLMSTTARSADEVQNAIIPALNAVGGHVAVDENGELIYSVLNPRPLPDERTLLERVVQTLVKVLSVSFITALSVVLVAYFAFYVVLLVCLAVAAVVAASQGGDCDCSCEGCECLECAKCGDTCGDCCVIGGSEKKAKKREMRAAKREKSRAKRVERKQRRLMTAAARRERRHEALVRMRKRAGLEGEREVLGLSLEVERVTRKPKFYRAVYDFIFGAPRPPRDARERERNIVAYLRAHAGRITAAEVVSLTGLPLEAAERVLLDVAARYEGDIEVTDSAALVYRFDRLAVTVADDVEDLAWIAGRGGSVTVGDFARRKELQSADALALLQRLAHNYHGRMETRGGTRFVFPESTTALAVKRAAIDLAGRAGRLGERPVASVDPSSPEERAPSSPEEGAEDDTAGSETSNGSGVPGSGARPDAERDYTYCWERLERSPAIIGIPEGERGWIYGFNILNLVLGLALTVYYAGGGTILEGGPTEAWIFAYLPFLFSSSVFAIPLARTITRAIANGKRLRRNAWRVFLLALFNRLEESDRVHGVEIFEAIYGPAALTRLLGPGKSRHQTHLSSFLDRAIRELDGSIDVESGLDRHGEHTYTFERLHNELTAVEHDRMTVDLSALQVKTIVYDSADPEI